MGSTEAYMIGSLIVSKMISAAMSRTDIPEEERKPFYLYIDECHHFLCKSLQEVLTGMRKFGLGLILSHQHISQLFESEDILAKAIMQSPNIRVVYQMDGNDASIIAKGFSHYIADDFKTLGRGESIVKVGSSEDDFELEAFWGKKRSKEEAEQVKKELIRHNQELYGAGITSDTIPAKTALQEKEETDSTPSSGFDHKEFAYTQKEITEGLKVGLEPDEETLLKLLANTPELIALRDIRKKLGYGQTRVNRLIKNLTDKKLISENEVHLGAHRKFKIFTLTPEGYYALDRPLPKGKGGSLHRYLQKIISEYATQNGYDVKIEEQTKKGLQVDIGLSKNGKQIAVEISVTTTAKHISGNIESVLSDDYDKVIQICSDKDVLDKTKTLLEAKFSQTLLQKVHFCLPDQWKAELA